MNSRRWFLGMIALALFLAAVPALVTGWVDPLFHFGPPKEQLRYPLNTPRYQNDGIVRHFSYDALISGSSMTQNFKTSELDSLFGTHSVKVPLSGASFREINDLMARALDTHPGVKLIVRGLDCTKLRDNWDDLAYAESSYPWYLYDENPFNDVSYLLNKDILFENTLPAISYTRGGRETTGFDEYCNWMEGRIFGQAAIVKRYGREAPGEPVPVTGEDLARLRENITRNVTDLAREYPDTEFYLFFPPYSAYWWDRVCRRGELELYTALFTEASRMMLEHENIRLYAFFEDTQLICGPENYKDPTHYHEDVNTQILHWMAQDQHRLTRENYEDYWQQAAQFYGSYDYEWLYALP